jgi:hypothetical protein
VAPGPEIGGMGASDGIPWRGPVTRRHPAGETCPVHDKEVQAADSAQASSACRCPCCPPPTGPAAELQSGSTPETAGIVRSPLPRGTERLPWAACAAAARAAPARRLPASPPSPTATLPPALHAQELGFIEPWPDLTMCNWTCDTAARWKGCPWTGALRGRLRQGRLLTAKGLALHVELLRL